MRRHYGAMHMIRSKHPCSIIHSSFKWIGLMQAAHAPQVVSHTHPAAVQVKLVKLCIHSCRMLLGQHVAVSLPDR